MSSAYQKQISRNPEGDLQVLTRVKRQKDGIDARRIDTPRIPRKDRIVIILDMLAQFALWQDRARSRRMLLQLDDHLLQDIGMTEDMLAAETGKPWWRV